MTSALGRGARAAAVVVVVVVVVVVEERHPVMGGKPRRAKSWERSGSTRTSISSLTTPRRIGMASISRSSLHGQAKEQAEMPTEPKQELLELDPLKAPSTPGTFLSAPSPSIRLYKSFDSLSSLSSIDVPMVERGHPLRSGR